MMVTRLACIAQRFVSSKRPTRYASAASCTARTADAWKRRSPLKSCAISRTRRWNGSLRMRSSVDFWYLRISRSATVPGLYLWGFLTPPVAGADFLAAFVASCLRGALPPVDLRAVCLVRAIFFSILGTGTLNYNFDSLYIKIMPFGYKSMTSRSCAHCKKHDEERARGAFLWLERVNAWMYCT